MTAPLDWRVSRRSLLKTAALGAVAVGGAPLLSACGGSSGIETSATAPAGSPKRGGNLRVGIVGGGAKDTVDAHLPVSHPDEARVFALYDSLLTRNPDYSIRPALAESLTPSSDPRTWTLKLRQGVTFHNGKPLTVDDVSFTFQRILDPKSPKSQATALSIIDLEALKKVDDHTLAIGLKSPSVILDDHLTNYAAGIVPAGYDPAKPVGTGPFKFQSFTPGQQSVFVRNDSYWQSGQPYADQLTIIDFPDDTARVNALLSGQVDVIDQVPLGQLAVVKANPGLRVLESETGAWIPFTMRVDAAPFSDVRVRQALRLLVDRQQMVDQVLSGHGKIGNDLYAPFDPMFARDLPQRHQDLDQAKSLLRQAGHSDLRVELVTSEVAAGTVEAAQVFARQAQDAGVTVKLKKVDSGVFYGDNYLKWDFAQDFWFTRNYLPQVAQGSLPTSPYNETHWKDPTFIDLVTRAGSTVDEAKRRQLLHDAQKIEHDSGGYIIWSFTNQVDAHSSKVNGLVPDKSGIPLTSYGFGRMWLG
ncbi:MAG TPA: ABC transporter substrate-binding protein [Actinomycetes bacterium]|jgi:peptide/nickel transport system substrate-binding protein|nr:ABC transporter substrate-binding protein [Actinomycetes bacterium]